MLYSITMLPPILFALWYQEPMVNVFLLSSLTTFFIGLLMWFPTYRFHREVRFKEGFLIVTLLWLLLAAVSTFPFLFNDKSNLQMSFIDAFFESISGLTTTGATVLTGLDFLPRSLLYYRQQLQLIGGGGIIIFGIAILPMLGVGGMQLFRAETSGPFKENKLTPRIAQTAKMLWMLYLGLIIICTLAYFLAGMNFFDALTHSYSTVSTGGFSTHDQSLGFFQSNKIYWVSIIFMLLGAINFSLHFIAVRSLSFRHYWQDVECRAYLYLILIMTILISVAFFYFKLFRNPKDAVTEGLFQAVAFCTTTGFSVTNYNAWPLFIPMTLLLVCLIGGCAGSTAGGIKMIRGLLLCKQWLREIERLIHPYGYYVIKLGLSRLHHRTLDAVWGFFGVFVLLFACFLVLLLATGLDLVTAFSGLVSAITSTGLGLGKISEHFKDINDGAKFILSVAMLAGRLEFFTILVLLTPSYWRS